MLDLAIMINSFGQIDLIKNGSLCRRYRGLVDIETTSGNDFDRLT
jgi:hypothetical protein